jgi:hypothetical protein
MTNTAPLTELDLRVLADARKLVALHGADAFHEHTGRADLMLAMAETIGQAQFVLNELVVLVERLTAANAERAASE